MDAIDRLAPSGPIATDYDRRHLSLYAALLDADEVGREWRDAATALMGIDIADEAIAEACWRSHLERARWILEDGLPAAITAFGADADRAA